MTYGVIIDARTGQVTEVGTKPDTFDADFEAAVQAHIDATARAKGYRNGDAAVSYKASTNAAWAAEGAAFAAWRDAVWQAVLTSAERPESIAAGIAQLPAMEWPE